MIFRFLNFDKTTLEKALNYRQFDFLQLHNGNILAATHNPISCLFERSIQLFLLKINFDNWKCECLDEQEINCNAEIIKGNEILEKI